MKKLLLGISASNMYVEINRLRGRQLRLAVNEEYLKLIATVDFTPILLPYSEDPNLPLELFPLLDGLLLAGGADLDRSVWQEGLTEDFKLDGMRTRSEDVMLAEAISRGVPVFGICRGLQQINSYFGGTLIEDIPTECDTLIDHKQSLPGNIPTHDLEWVPDSWCGRTVSEPVTPVNSYHHQAIDRPGEGVSVCGLSPDGIIEAIECDSESFIAAVQFHPERMPLAQGVQQLMRGFYDVCKEFRANRKR
jgi:putative glutamine amidotransferase